MTITECNATIPGNISRIVQSKGLVQKFIAEHAGFSEQQFSDMLNGRKIIKPCDILAISNALGIEAGDLFSTDRTAPSRKNASQGVSH